MEIVMLVSARLLVLAFLLYALCLCGFHAPEWLVSGFTWGRLGSQVLCGLYGYVVLYALLCVNPERPPK